MKIDEFMNESYIKLNLEGQTKEEVIRELVQVLDDAGVVNDYELLVDDVLVREKLSSTGIGLRIGLPHAKSRHILKPSIAFGVSKQGVDFDSMDQDKAHIFFLICMPEEGFNLHLKVLAMLSRSLINPSFREALEVAESTEQVMQLLSQVE